jgi:hypothetical protein
VVHRAGALAPFATDPRAVVVRGWWLAPLVVWCAAPFLPVCIPQVQQANESGSFPAGLLAPARFAVARREDPIRLIIVRDGDPLLLCVAAPVAVRLSLPPPVVPVVVVGSPPSPEAVALTARLKPPRSLVLASEPDPDLARGLEHLPADVVVTEGRLTHAALALAKRVWGAADRVVAAPADDPGAALRAATLAAHLRAPFVPITGDPNGLAAGLDALKTGHVLLVGPPDQPLPDVTGTVNRKIERLDGTAAERLVIRALGSEGIRNVIVSRLPDAADAAGELAWLAPYLAAARRAPLVLCHDGDGFHAEQAALVFIRAHGLAPHSFTLLGSYGSIGTITLKEHRMLDDFAVEVEPCSWPRARGAATYAVGRILGPSPQDASALIARTLLRKRLVAHEPFRALMIANPSTQYGPLPLCETVSRVTAEEFKNHRIAITELYGQQADTPAAQDAAKTAHLILFEGHITDQLLFSGPAVEPLDLEPVPDPPPPDDWALGQGEPPPPNPAEEDRTLDPQGAEPDEPPQAAEADPPAADENAEEPAPEPLAPDVDQAAPPPAADTPRPPPTLEGLPLVILQSCHSLEEPTARIILSHGGVGLVGSTTNIHSASGSAFIKAFCDAVLYRDATAGEALRDARNYFLCLAELKAKRGHKQQAKAVRVALSFRLWGDPELRVVHGPRSRPRLQPVRIRMDRPDRVRISIPARRLPECTTDKYRARMFPGSQAAGIVKSAANKPRRRLMPVYFAPVAAPDEFAERAFAGLHRTGDKDARAAFLLDDHRRRLYLLYFPDKETARAAFTLRFRN